MKTYLLYIRKFSIMTGEYKPYIYKTTTDNIYRVIGKIYVTTLAEIERIVYITWTPAKEQFLKEEGHEIINYIEPQLSEDILNQNDTGTA